MKIDSSNGPLIASTQGQRSDDAFVSVPKPNTKPCKFCKTAGHRGYVRCPKILKHCTVFGTQPLQPSDDKARYDLVQKLIKDNQVVTHPLALDDNRVIYKSLPKKVMALIIHGRFVRRSIMTEKGIGVSSVLVQLTFLIEGGEAHPIYNDVLFEANPITKWIQRSSNNIIVSQLEDISTKEDTPQKQNRSSKRSPLKDLSSNKDESNQLI
jgi:hypothetical protein